MKFKHYINEVVDSLSEDVIKVIERDCQPFIKDWQRLNTMKWLMSGRKKITPIIEKKKTRKNRNPVDTPLVLHYHMDFWFYDKFKIRARSNVIFVHLIQI